MAAIQKTVPMILTDRFTFVARKDVTLIAAVGAILQGDDSEGGADADEKPDSLILVGRNSDAKINDGALPDAANVLGSYSAGCIRMLSQMGTDASVLVVQARKV